MREISAQMSMTSDTTRNAAADKLRAAGYDTRRGVDRLAYKNVLNVRHLADEAEKTLVEDLIRSDDPDARPVIPQASFATT